MSTVGEKTFSVETILRLACAAQRLNNAYVKEGDHGAIYADDGKMVSYRHSNKDLVKAMLIPSAYDAMKELRPPLLNVNKADEELSSEIRKYFKRLIFAAVEGENEFQTTVHSLLGSEECSLTHIGFLVCLPSVYQKDSTRTRVRKSLKDCEPGVIGVVGEELLDLDSEIIDVRKSKNFDAHNVTAIINNKIASWMTSKPPVVGPAVIVKAKVKGYNENWITKLPETRLHYVKVAQ